MSIIMEGMTISINNNNKTKQEFDYVWERLEKSHVETYSMHESFFADDPKMFTRHW